MTEVAGASWLGGWDEPGVLSVVLIAAGTPGSGLFVYSGAPAAGNLIYSITAAAGHDLFGNATLGGATSYQFTGGTYQAVNIFNAQLNWYSATTEAGPWTIGTGIDGRDNEINIGTGTGTVQVASNDVILGNNGALQVNFPTQSTGLDGATIAPNGIYQRLVGVEDTWHAMTPLANSWANLAGQVTCQYRLIASPPNTVEIIGTLNAAAATANTFFTLPAGYRPASAQQFPIGVTSGATANTVPSIQCATSGALTTNRVGLGAANDIVFHGFISLDA
jgi:hypothetical protein